MSTSTLTGYCGDCQMIVDLTPGGLLARHGSRYTYPSTTPKPCPGTCHLPSPLPATPEVPEAAFSSAAREPRCGRCESPDAIGRVDGGQVPYMRMHDLRPGVQCPGSWEPILWEVA